MEDLTPERDVPVEATDTGYAAGNVAAAAETAYDGVVADNSEEDLPDDLPTDPNDLPSDQRGGRYGGGSGDSHIVTRTYSEMLQTMCPEDDERERIVARVPDAAALTDYLGQLASFSNLSEFVFPSNLRIVDDPAEQPQQAVPERRPDQPER